MCCAAERRVAPIVARTTSGTFQLAARHVVDLGGLVHELIHDQRQEVAEHDVDDGPHAGHRGADADAGEPGLRDRRVDDALRAELVDEPLEHLERRAGLGDVLAHQEDASDRGASLRAIASRMACAEGQLTRDCPRAGLGRALGIDVLVDFLGSRDTGAASANCDAGLHLAP